MISDKEILILSGFYHPHVSGAEVFAQRLAEYFAQRNRVTVVTGKWSKEDAVDEVTHEVRIKRIPVINKKNLRLVSYALSAVFNHPNKADLIHAHLAFPAGVSGAVIKKKIKAPLLTTVQGGDLGDYSENTGKFGGILKPIISYGLKRADLVHAVSKDCERKAKELGAKHTIVIPNGVDVTLFNPHVDAREIKEKLGITNERVIVSLSRLTPKNGLDLLIRAMPEIIKEKKDVVLVLVGSGEQENELKKLAQKLRISDKIIFTGGVPHSETPKYLRMADVAIRPSLDEGFGIFFIEAMACGVPTIGTAVGGITDIIIDEDNGLLIDPKVSEISKSIIRVLNDRNLSKKLARNGIKTVKEKYDWDKVLKRVEKVYEEII